MTRSTRSERRSEWWRALAGRRETWRAQVRRNRERRRACKEAEPPGPPPHPFALLPWLLLGMGAFSNLFQGETPNPWLGGLGVLTFNSCYIYVAVRAFVKEKRESVSTRVALALMALVTIGLALGYGGSWVLFFPLLGLATGASLRGRPLRIAGVVLAVVAGAVAFHHKGWGGLDTAYATWISTIVTAVILSLSEAVRELRAAREELARQAVDQERLRFSRDLHDLLGHTLSVIVVKSEAARRLAPARLDAALTQIADIESVGRQALTEIREAVTGYREGSLATELDRAHSALTAAGVTPSVHRSGAPVEPQTAALLGWVVREAVTNVVRHSGATTCEITVSVTTERVSLTVTDNGTGAAIATDGCETDGTGTGTAATCAVRTGTGLTGLRERLAAAGGSLTAGPGRRGGFTVTAELPVETGFTEPERPDPATTSSAPERTRGTATPITAEQPRGATARSAAEPPRETTAPSAAAQPQRATRATAPEPAREPAAPSGAAGEVPSVQAGPTLGP
ncbi:histidine kinase [Streptomyces sp. NPDC005820]|uniref:sensor histidine kinase n=1 Tax=Streptomyces sp. NPDC005820 TaxID=3157069 RepID=UPI0033EADB98